MALAIGILAIQGWGERHRHWHWQFRPTDFPYFTSDLIQRRICFMKKTGMKATLNRPARWRESSVNGRDVESLRSDDTICKHFFSPTEFFFVFPISLVWFRLRVAPAQCPPFWPRIWHYQRRKQSPRLLKSMSRVRLHPISVAW